MLLNGQYSDLSAEERLQLKLPNASIKKITNFGVMTIVFDKDMVVIPIETLQNIKVIFDKKF